MFITMAIVCGLVSMLAYGLANVFSQPLAQKLGAAQVLFLRGLTIMVVLGAGAALSHPAITHYKDIVLVVLLGIGGYLPVLAFTHGIKVSRISVMAPVAGTSPLVTVLLSFFILHMHIHALQWPAIFVVIGANIAMSVDLKNWRNSNIAQLSSGVPFALIAALGWGCFFFAMVYATRWLGPWLAAFLVEVGVTVAAGLHLLLTSQRVPLRQAVTRPVILNGMLICVGTVVYAIGVRHYNVSIVATLSNSTAIVAALVATYKFHEHLTRAEKIAATVMVAGIIVISLF